MTMPRSQRVLSFMSQWGGGHQRSPSNSAPPSPTTAKPSKSETPAPSESQQLRDSPTAPPRFSHERSNSRPSSMIAPYQPPTMEMASDTPPELLPIFTYLSSHSNKLYQEGYFLKLHDLDSRGRPSADRTWTECFAQLVGTILSLWDATQLDIAGDDGEVVPAFINLTDASIKMIESLPMNGEGGQALQNVLSISTAANNRYLLHFNSLHSLTQWTAGIRLAMYEHATLQEAYTGSILAGKGKHLNNIRAIMERSRFPTQDWARVRFGAGTPWRRCWCVITPPDEKEVQKAQKSLKKRATYDRSLPTIKGDIKFYESRKVTKKSKPIATITDAFSCYAIYPQSRPLIEQSTLMKVEGLITIHSTPESTTEGFVFVMPEVHPAISGFEMMLRWLIPAFDTFALYGRPNRLVADVLDIRSLMFAMPSSRRYGYLELIDVAGLIHTEGSQTWNEREWRKQMKNLTSKRMTALSAAGNRMSTFSNTQSPSRSSLNLSSFRKSGVKFGEDPSVRSSPASRRGSPPFAGDNGETPIPPAHGVRVNSPATPSSPYSGPRHHRSVSESQHFARSDADDRMAQPRQQDQMLNGHGPPAPPPHGVAVGTTAPSRDEQSYEHDLFTESSMYGPAPPRHGQSYPPRSTNAYANGPPAVAPVVAPPAFAHNPGQKPHNRPNAMPDLRLANQSMDPATLAQMAEAQQGVVQHRPTTQPSQLASIPGTPGVELDNAFPSLQPEPPSYRATTPTARGPAAPGISRKPIGSRTS